MKITGNEPANPMAAFRTEHLEGMSENGILTGLTIRQQFAMVAMQGVISGIHSNENVLAGLLKSSDSLKIEPENIIAQMAIEYADALIEELNK